MKEDEILSGFPKLSKSVETEPFAKLMEFKLVKVAEGYSLVQMRCDLDKIANLYGMVHGGALSALIDEALEIAGSTESTTSVSFNLNVSHLGVAKNGDLLFAEAKRVSMGRRMSVYAITVKTDKEVLIASCQATTYRTNKYNHFVKQEGK